MPTATVQNALWSFCECTVVKICGETQ